jgi:ribosomal protein S18 acetylase RimI-like enzyme
VIRTRAATEAEAAAWQDNWRARLRAWYDKPDVAPDWVTQQVERQLSRLGAAEVSAVFALDNGHNFVGMLAVALTQQDGDPGVAISDIWIVPEHRRKGHGTAALRHAEAWAANQQARSVWVRTDPADPVHAAFFAGYPVRARQMIKTISGPGQLAAGLEGRSMTDSEFADWRAGSVRDYAADMTDSGTLPAAEAAIASATQFDQLLPGGLRTENHSFRCLCADGEVVATNWIGHHYSPGVSWVYGVETHEGHRGKGYGRAAMVIGERATLTAGDTHLGLNVFGHNAVAIGMYESMGYRAYDHGRSVEL